MVGTEATRSLSSPPGPGSSLLGDSGLSLFALLGLTLTLVEEVCNDLFFLCSPVIVAVVKKSSEGPRNISASSYGGISGMICAILPLSFQ